MAQGFDTSKILAKLEKVAKEFEGKSVTIGWFDGNAYEDGTPVAYVAAIQEYGAPARGIPARPFLKPAKEAHKAEWADTVGKGVRQVLRGEKTAEQVLNEAGLQAQGDIKAQIKTTTSPPLSPVTLLLRKWRRQGKTITGKTVGQAAAALKNGASVNGAPTTPLNDTGQLIATLTYTVGESS